MVENDVVVVEVLVVETVFGVESEGLRFGFFHWREGRRRRCGIGVWIRSGFAGGGGGYG